MGLTSDDYGTEIISQSMVELQELTKWQKVHQGEWTTVIGGWAVWAYYQESFGSRDIDIVLPEDAVKRVEITDTYFPAHKIEKKFEDPFQTKYHYGKYITTPTGNDEIIFDLFYPENPRPDPDGLGVTVDWKWMSEFSKEQPIENDVFIQVPDPELLLPVKMVAALSRIEELQRTDNRERKQSKIWKDYYDVAILVKHVDFNQEHLLGHMNRIGFTRDLVTRFLDGYVPRPDTLEQAETTLMDVTDKIPSLE